MVKEGITCDRKDFTGRKLKRRRGRRGRRKRRRIRRRTGYESREIKQEGNNWGSRERELKRLTKVDAGTRQKKS